MASDVDLAATFAAEWKKRVGGLEYFGHLDDLERELSARFGRLVHLTDHEGTESGAGNRVLGRAIARDGQLVYESETQAKRRASTHR